MSLFCGGIVLNNTALLFGYELQTQQDQECNSTSIKAEENISWITPSFPSENSHSGVSITLIS